MSLVVRAFPLIRPVEELGAFASALRNERSAGAAEFYRKYNVWHESWHVQETPMGHWVIGVTAIDDADEAGPRYSESRTDFDTWFKRRVFEITGINPDETPLGPPTTQVFSWSDDHRPNSDLCAKGHSA
jgi:hypothetical protein